MARNQTWVAPPLLIGVIGGMVAGMAMAMVEMVYDLFSESRSIWDSPMAITAWVFGEEHFTANDPGAHVGPVILGLLGHMMNSALVGIVLVAVLRALRVRGVVAPVMLGVGYALAIWVLMRYVVLPLNEVEDALFTTDIVTPQWVWWVAHVALGMTAGLVYAIAARPRAPTARIRTAERPG